MEFCDHLADVKPVGWHDQPIPEASDAGTEASYLVDGKAGNTNFPHGNMKAGFEHLRNKQPIIPSFWIGTSWCQCYYVFLD